MSGRDRLDNDAPTIHSVAEVRQPTQHELDDSHVDPVDAREVFDIIRAIGDPEHPLTLEQLRVVEERLITVDNSAMVPFTSPAAAGAGADEEEGVGGGGDPRKLPAGALCRRVHVQFTPTIPHCSMATLIGLSIRLKLERSLPADTKIRVSIAPGTHVSELAVNRQLADKERVAAATENSRLLEVVHQCIAPSVLQC